MTVDWLNGSFELIGSLLTWKNAQAYWRVREARGVYWPTTAFFTAWGVWNLAYYPALDQWASFAGAALLALGNGTWVALVVYDLKKKGSTDSNLR